MCLSVHDSTQTKQHGHLLNPSHPPPVPLQPPRPPDAPAQRKRVCADRYGEIQRRLRCQHRVTSSIPSCRVAQTGNQVSLKVWDVAHVSPFLSSSPGKAAHALLLPRALAAAQLLASSPARRLPITSLAGAHATSAACLANAAALGLAAAVRRGSFAPLTGR